MTILTEKSRLIVRVWLHDLRKWWRSRRWVRRRIIARTARIFVPLDGADERYFKYRDVPGAVIRNDNPHTFPVEIAKQQNGAPAETEFERRYLKAMRPAQWGDQS